jgi:hypothetical protein
MKNLKNIVAFCVLMGNEKILTKSPAYIMEKFKRYCNSDNPDEWKWGLDNYNTDTLNDWIKKWLK